MMRSIDPPVTAPLSHDSLPHSRSAHLSLSFLSPFHPTARHILQRRSYCPAFDCIAPSSLISLARGIRSCAALVPLSLLALRPTTARTLHSQLVTDYSAASFDTYLRL
jgi:hypothetical protein